MSGYVVLNVVLGLLLREIHCQCLRCLQSEGLSRPRGFQNRPRLFSYAVGNIAFVSARRSGFRLSSSGPENRISKGLKFQI